MEGLAREAATVRSILDTGLTARRAFLRYEEAKVKRAAAFKVYSVTMSEEEAARVAYETATGDVWTSIETGK